MIAKQYSVQLPADYDMSIIRRRVEAAAPRFDAFPGLTWKAFLIRERGRNGALSSEYTPFYIWPDTDALWGFAAGDGFKGIIASFGWRPIRSWLPFHVVTRPGLESGAVRTATQTETPITPTEDLAGLRHDEIAANEASADDQRLQARVVAVDLQRWTLMRFALWSCDAADLPAEASPRDTYEVLHVSAPGVSR